MAGGGHNNAVVQDVRALEVGEMALRHQHSAAKIEVREHCGPVVSAKDHVPEGCPDFQYPATEQARPRHVKPPPSTSRCGSTLCASS